MAEHGSFNWYINSDDKFFVNLVVAIMHADNDNSKKLMKAFPHLCTSHKECDWDFAPKTNYEITKNETRKEPELKNFKLRDAGTFGRYLRMSGDFVTHLAKAIIHADDDNRKIISTQYPQIVAAHNEKHWDMCPKGFEYPLYNSLPKS